MPDKMAGNRGEWSEIYIFLKLISDGKVYAADRNMDKLDDVFLNIIKIFREEVQYEKYEYCTGSSVKILLNGESVGPDIDSATYARIKECLWTRLSEAGSGNSIEDIEVENFLNRIHINKLKAPAFTISNFFGGTQDITMEVMDYRSGINSVIGFSCKSDFSSKATLFNASGENTNFVFKVVGNISDEVMDEFNSLFIYKNKTDRNTGEISSKAEVAIGDRMRLLKERGCDLLFAYPSVGNAERNLVLSGGTELPLILGNMLRYYYFVGEGKSENSSMVSALVHVIKDNSANYKFDNVGSIYYRKIGTLLYDMFTGMRLSKDWDGRSTVNGGYIIAKNDGDVLAYHSCMADEFKDFLIEQLGFESPSAARHKYMDIYKKDGEYFIKLNLQIRFKGKNRIDNENLEKRLWKYFLRPPKKT